MQPTLATRIPLYDLSFHLYVSGDWEGLGEVPGLDPEDLPGRYEVAQVSTVEVPSEQPEYLGQPGLRIIMFLSPAASLNTITHECFHVAAAVFEYIGAPINDGAGGEPFAYLVGWLAQEVDKTIRSVRTWS